MTPEDKPTPPRNVVDDCGDHHGAEILHTLKKLAPRLIPKE